MRPTSSSSEALYVWVGIGVSALVVVGMICAVYFSWK